MSTPRHFLNKRAKELFAAYNKLERKPDPVQYAVLMKRLQECCPQAFHTKESLSTRKFFHCPVSTIPYHSCVITRRSL